MDEDVLINTLMKVYANGIIAWEIKYKIAE